MADELDEFEEQLRLERLAAEAEAKKKTKTDEDGTVFEWDEEKKAWFPKIDANFIAQYQMSYGTATDDPSAEAASSGTPEVQQDYLTYEDYVKFYYGTYREAFDIESHLSNETKAAKLETEGAQAARAKALMNEDGSVIFDEEAKKKYDEYCAEYYKAWETGKYDYFIKHYNYDEEEVEGEEGEKKKKKKGMKRKKDAGWFDAQDETNTNVYVANLPTDITFDEFVELMNRAGMIMFDPFTRKPKLKLYTGEDGKYKGDGRCCYIKSESVDLALRFIDGSELRGQTIHVERAQFAMKGAYNPKLRKALSNRQKKKMKKQQEKLFDWRPDKPRGARGKHEKTVVIKHLFEPKEFEVDPTLINEIRDDVTKECSKFGEVKKVVVYDRHVDGVATVMFAEPEFADECVKFMNKRWFAKRQLTAETWDGNAKFVVEETEEQKEARLKQWEDYLEDGESSATAEKTKMAKKTGNSSDESSAVSAKNSAISANDSTLPAKDSAISAKDSAPSGTVSRPASSASSDLPRESTESGKRDAEERGEDKGVTDNVEMPSENTRVAEPSENASSVSEMTTDD